VGGPRRPGIQARLGARLVRLALRAYHTTWRPRLISVYGARILVPRGVFIPLGTVSSGLLAGILASMEVGPGRLLDIGCGSGVLAVVAALHGWEAVCYEPSPAGRAAARLNVALNGLQGRVSVTGDPREVVELGPYDVVVSNPPYLPLEPRDRLDELWCAGEDLRVLKAIGRLAGEASPGGLMIASLSSLTPLEAGVEALGLKNWRVVACKLAGIDRVYIVEGRLPSRGPAPLV